MIEWLPTVLKGIGDAKVADVLREKVGLLELQRDTAIGERDVLATKLAQAKEQIETLEADKLDLQTRIDDLSQKPLAPFKVSDEYVFDTESGYWIHTDDYLRVCNDCLLPPTKIVSPLFEAVGSGMEYEDEYKMVWRCGKCGRDYFHKK
jgi:hypothetical protein